MGWEKAEESQIDEGHDEAEGKWWGSKPGDDRDARATPWSMNIYGDLRFMSCDERLSFWVTCARMQLQLNGRFAAETLSDTMVPTLRQAAQS